MEYCVYGHGKMKAKEDIAYNQFKEMEKRYHTWMNYYSLFNGALLVAYCTILVSTGQVIEMGGEFFNDGIIGNAKLFQLECTYWNILALIAFLGCIASYYWYLSAIGHYHWIGRWRNVMMAQENYPKLDFSDVGICNVSNKAIHYHSTFKITKIFIAAVMYSWIFVAYCSFEQNGFILKPYSFYIISFVWISLILLEYVIHGIIGSDLAEFNKEKSDSCLVCLLKKLYEIIGEYVLVPLLVIGLIILGYKICKNDENEKIEKQQVLMDVEIVNGDSLIVNDNVAVTIE